MESTEFADLSENLYKALERLSGGVEEAQNKHADDFSRPVKDLGKEEGAANLALTSKQLTEKLEKQMLESSSEIREGFPESDLHVYLSALSDMDQECEKQVLLIKKRKEEIERLKTATNEINEMKNLLEEIIKDRERMGEMAELRGYSNNEIIKMEKEVYEIFKTHRDRLHQILPKLFPDCTNEMFAILTKLADNAFGNSESTYVKLEDHKDWSTAGQILLQMGIVSSHPQRKTWLTLAILD